MARGGGGGVDRNRYLVPLAHVLGAAAQGRSRPSGHCDHAPRRHARRAIQGAPWLPAVPRRSDGGWL
eukprot:2889409-Pleurochrysis_carterae.AAC.1